MKEYTVEWYGAEKMSAQAFNVDAENEQEAFDKAVEQYAIFEWRKAYPGMKISSKEGGDKHFVNPHFDPNYEAMVITSPSRQQASPLFTSPQSSDWAKLHRVCGGFTFVVGLIVTISVAEKNEVAGFQLAVMTIAVTLTCFLFGFLIDVLTDMRHYLKTIAEKE
tara:strand:+ start:115 stop:606 length:492 start_codon:yes stop_codon:yes gene_type:complete